MGKQTYPLYLSVLKVLSGDTVLRLSFKSRKIPKTRGLAKTGYKKRISSRLFRQKGINVKLDDENIVNLKFGNAQSVGSREYQEDSFGYSNISSGEAIALRGVLAILADGMGGLSNGKQVSEYIVFAIKTVFENFDTSVGFASQLENMIMNINDKVYDEFSSDGKSEAGSTVVVAYIDKTKLYWLCVGDSRLYLLRDSMLYQVNEDHDYLNQLFSDVMHSEMAKDNALLDPQKDSLSSFIGNGHLSFVDVNTKGFSLQKGDVLVLCSDGVYNSISNAEMIEYLEFDPQVAADKIVKKVLAKKMEGQDNLTIMIINYNAGDIEQA